MSSPVALHGLGFSTTTSTDSRAWLWVAGFLSLIYSLLSIAARLVAKWGLLWYDDGILAVGYALAITHWGLLYTSISTGLGVSALALSPIVARQTARLYFSARILLQLSHCLAKLSILVFTRRIFAGDIHKENLIFGIAYSLTILYGILAVVLSSAGCNPDEVLVASPNALCPQNITRWIVITIFDAVTELCILAMPVWFISLNQLKASKKRIVIFVYMFRLAIIAFAIAKTTAYVKFLNHGRDNIGMAPVVAWQEILLSFSLVSASFPCLRSFIWAFMSRGLMTMYGNTTNSGSGSGSGSRGASVQLRSLTKSNHASHHDIENDDSRVRLRPEQTGYRVDVSHEHRGNHERGRGNTGASDDSDLMIIHQETSYRVDSIRL